MTSRSRGRHAVAGGSPGGGAAADRIERPVCPECDEPAFDDGAVHHELVCDGCGLVVDTHYIDHGPEWRAYSYDEYESKARTGGPTTHTRHDRGLTTAIDWRDEDAAGNALSPEGRRKAGRLRRWQGRVRAQGSGERTLRRILGEVGRMAGALGVPEPTREIAATICHRAVEAGAVRGRSVEGVATGALYAACRRSGAPRSLDELTGVSRVARREVGRTYKHLSRELGLDLEPPHPRQYVARICSDLDLPESVHRRARTLVERAADAGLIAGKSPTGYAGAAVFAAALVAGRDPERKRVAEAAGVTPVTIRTHAEEQLETVGSAAVAAGLVAVDESPPAGWRERIDLDLDPDVA
jgi:transcription initiation factor TFIIB